jgi:hypothetical protein
MRRYACIFLIFLTLTLGDIFSNGGRDESYQIRRAYIDVLGVFPTIEEIDWYCVYNTKGYELAVDWITRHPKYAHLSESYSKNKLLSDDYKYAPQQPLAAQKLHEAIFYFAGQKYSQDKKALYEAKLKFIAYARQCATNELDAIDYMASELMSRTTRLDEANKMLAYLKSYSATLPEEKAWVAVLDELLKLPDICNK